MIKDRVRRVGATTLAAAALSAGALAATSDSAQAAEGAATGKSYQGCPYGAVCIYPGTGWNGGKPSTVYFSYGAHKLYNEYGTHRIYNNQYGGASVSFCKGSSGTQCGQTMGGGFFGHRALTPINSIKLKA